MLTTVLIDVDNTLLDFTKCAAESVRNAFLESGLSYNDRIFSVFTEINTILWQEIEDGKITRDELHKIRWNRIFGELCIDKDGEKFEKLFLKNLENSCHEVEGAGQLLMYLHSKYTVCIASNSTYKQQYKRLKAAGMMEYIDYMFVSEKIGFDKPAKEFFDACMRELGKTQKDEVIMIGDSPNADIRGAEEYGIHTCWFNYNHIEKPSDMHVDYMVNSLAEIKDII